MLIHLILVNNMKPFLKDFYWMFGYLRRSSFYLGTRNCHKFNIFLCFLATITTTTILFWWKWEEPPKLITYPSSFSTSLIKQIIITNWHPNQISNEQIAFKNIPYSCWLAALCSLWASDQWLSLSLSTTSQTALPCSNKWASHPLPAVHIVICPASILIHFLSLSWTLSTMIKEKETTNNGDSTAAASLTFCNAVAEIQFTNWEG